MTKSYASWTVLPYEPIERLAENLWRVEGTLSNMPLRRVMTLARMNDGRLVIHNAIALHDAQMREIEAWGTPAFLVVPNGYHRLDAPAFKQRYPALRVVCPRGARKRVQQVVAVDFDYDDFPGDDTVRLEHLRGLRESEGVMHVRSQDGVTLVFNDALFNMPHLPGLQGAILRYLTQSSGGPRVSRIGRMLLIADRKAFAADLLRLSRTPDLVRVIVGHHQTIATEPAAALARVAATL